MHNERVPARPFLRRKNCSYGRGIQSVRSQPVNRLRWKRNRASPFQNRGSLVQRLLRFGLAQFIRIHLKVQCMHVVIINAARGFGLAPYRILAAMGAIETEIKFRVGEVAELEAKLSSIGFRCITPRSFESNTLYDTPDRKLRLKRELVRIRRYDGRWLLTHKRIPDSGIGEDRHKHRVETETELSDGEALAEVFATVGFVPVFRYEKWRAEWSDDAGHCVIDETPLGTFAELEGAPDWIDSIAHALGVAPEDRTTLSYGRLFETWKEQTGSTAEHLTFDEVAANQS